MKRSPGQALVSAIFLVVVLVALGLSMVSLTGVQQDTGTKSLLSAKVYYGAKAGLEWGIQQAIAPATPVCGATTTFALTQTGLNGISVTVTCSSTTHGAGNFVYYITSCATNGTSCAAPGTLGNANYAERRLEATVSNIP